MQTAVALSRSIAADIAAGRLGPGDTLPSIREVARDRECASGTVARSYARLRSAGVVAGHERSRLRVTREGAARARALLRGGEPLRLTGSDDPALDLLLGVLGDRVTLTPGPRGSVTGLGLLARGEADAATLHLRHVGSGRHNDEFVRPLCAGGPVSIMHLWRREQVLVLPPGNPDDIRSPADLAGRRLAWRGTGTGTRLLLERVLREAGTLVSADRGVTVDSHLGVAVAVVSGAADAGLAVRAAAESVGAAWLPVADEPFELAIRSSRVDAVEELLGALGNREWRAGVRTLGGYDLSQAGTMRGAA